MPDYGYEWGWFRGRLLDLWTVYGKWLREQPGSNAKDKRRLFSDFALSEKRRRAVSEWLRQFENLEDLYREHPMMKSLQQDYFKPDGMEVFWLEQRPWREPGDRPAPEWFRKWLPMLVIWVQERRS